MDRCVHFECSFDVSNSERCIWCVTDRILMRAMPGHEIRLTGYASAWKVTSSDHDPVYATYEFNAPERPLTGNYRRVVLEIGMMEVSELTTPGGADMICTFNFPFLDDIKKGIKFKHSVRMVVRQIKRSLPAMARVQEQIFSRSSVSCATILS